MKTNAEIIKQWREHNHTSVRTLAVRLGVSASYISDIENGNRPVSRSFAAKAGEVLEIPLHVHRFICACGEEK